MQMDPNHQELIHVFQLFFDELPCQYTVINTSHGDADFRETLIAQWPSGEKCVIKLSDNDFTFPEKIAAWKRCACEYRKMGYYCPRILPSKHGDFPRVAYKGHTCVVYAEEFSQYKTAQKRCTEDSEETPAFDVKLADAAWLMTAKVAAKRFDFCDYPSGYCLFESFCPSDRTDEVLENAQAWLQYAQGLPQRFQTQVQRIWDRWLANRHELSLIYPGLPTSVFQADLNPTNLLLDERGEFAGVCDFNLCGRDVFLNYLFREIHWQFDEQYLLDTLKKLRCVYRFSDLEIQAAPLLYRCLKPLWFTELDALKAAGTDEQAVERCLNAVETLQTKEIAFAAYMRDDASADPVLPE